MQEKWSNAHRRDTTYHPIFGWLYVPNQLMRVPDPTQPYYIRTNNQGFRSNFDFNKESLAKKRIIFLGDSFTAGNGVTNENRFSDLLMDSIGNLECYNFGLTASGTDQQVLIYEHMAQQFDHDLIFLGFAAWDIKRLGPEAYGHPKPYFYENGGELTLANIPVPRHSSLRGPETNNASEVKTRDKRLYELSGHSSGDILRLGAMTLARRLYELSGHSSGDIWSRMRESQSYFSELLLSYGTFNDYGRYYNNTDTHWHLMERIITRLIDDAGNETIILFPIPEVRALSTVSKSKYRSLFEHLQNEFENVIFLDIADYVKDYPRRNRHNMISRSTGHFSKFGNLIVSNAIRECLVNNGLV